MAPLVRTGGSRHTGLAALPHRNIQANCYLLDKTVGKEYKSIEQNRENEQKELSINLNIVEQKHFIDTEQIETELKEAETNLEDDEGWGDNLYTP